MPNIAYVNGLWSPLADATISIEDRGFQFGDGVYEVIRTYGQAIFGLPAHLERLRRSASEIEITLSMEDEVLTALVHEGCKNSSYTDIQIYIQVTRGISPRNHAFPEQVQPTLLMTFRETKPVATVIRNRGISIISTEDIRWDRCHVKSLNLLPNVMAREAAKREKAFEAIFVRSGLVMEGAGSNLFAVFGKTIYTAPEGAFILSGITRDLVLKLVRQLGLTLREEAVSLQRLHEADEVFITGTTVEILPVVKLDGVIIASGNPGDVTKDLYAAFVEDLRHW